jgi:hypothetical protein
VQKSRQHVRGSRSPALLGHAIVTLRSYVAVGRDASWRGAPGSRATPGSLVDHAVLGDRQLSSVRCPLGGGSGRSSRAMGLVA